MLHRLYGCKIDTESNAKNVVKARIGSLCDLEFSNIDNAMKFAAGYRSGMARIWRTTYEMPTDFKTYRKRGARFAWLAHVCGRIHKDAFPEIEVIR